MAERFLREKFGAEVCDHHIFAICSDGDLMEGVASEAASLAGHLALGRCVFLYDDNEITIDGPTEPRVLDRGRAEARSSAYGWHTLTVEDGNDLEAIEAAIRAGMAEEERPTLISLKTVIGFGSPRAGTRNAHSDPMPRREGARDEGGARLGSRRAVPRSRRGLRRTGATRARARRRGAGRVAGAVRRLGGREPRARRRVERRLGRQARRPGFADALPVFEPGGRGDLDAQGRGAR